MVNTPNVNMKEHDQNFGFTKTARECGIVWDLVTAHLVLTQA